MSNALTLKPNLYFYSRPRVQIHYPDISSSITPICSVFDSKQYDKKLDLTVTRPSFYLIDPSIFYVIFYLYLHVTIHEVFSNKRI